MAEIPTTSYEDTRRHWTLDSPLNYRVPPDRGCISTPPAGDDQTPVDAYPRSPLKVVALIHYLGTIVNGSETAMTTLILNLTIAPKR